MAPTSDLQAYLANKYMSGAKADAINAREEAKRKKKKRKTTDTSAATSSALSFIKDDDAPSGWMEQNDDADMGPAVEERNVTFVGKGKTAWSVIRPSKDAPTIEETEPPVAEDEQPQIIASNIVVEDVAPPSFVGGLQDSQQIRAQAEAHRLAKEANRKANEARKAQQMTQQNRNNEDEEEVEGERTVHRDTSGQVIDTKAGKASEKRRKERDLEKAMQKMEWGKGLVQREQKKDRSEELAAMAKKPFARGADDVEMNTELKEVQRWNDPAARFLTNAKKTSKSNLPRYTGPAPPPNRYGIPPGYRWDGVDRSNGFEKKFAQKGNERKRTNVEAHMWSTDDM